MEVRNPGVVPPTAAPSPAPSTSQCSFMPVQPVPTTPTVKQQSGKQSQPSSTNRYAPIAHAQPTRKINVVPTTSVLMPSTGYEYQNSVTNLPRFQLLNQLYCIYLLRNHLNRKKVSIVFSNLINQLQHHPFPP